MTANTLELGDGNVLTTGQVCTGAHFADGSQKHFDLNDLGEIAEWLAIAWQNVSGEEYKPVIISSRGYVADAGVLAE